MTKSLTELEGFPSSLRASREKHWAEGAPGRARDVSYSREVAKILASRGLIGLTIPEACGGHGAVLKESEVGSQEVTLVWPKNTGIVQATNFGAICPFGAFSTPEPRERFPGGFLDVEALIALDMNKVEAESDLAELTTTVEDGDRCDVKGMKIWSTRGVEATGEHC